MAYSDRERGAQDGQPIALYRLDWGKTRWFYTSADREVEHEEDVDGVLQVVTYVPKAMSDGGMVQGSSSQNDFTLNGPSDLPIVALFRNTPPSLSILLTVRRIHAGETEAPIYWIGDVTNVKRPTDAKCVILGKPASARLDRTGLRLCWTRECPHFIYDSGCKLHPEDWRVEAEVVENSGTTIRLTLAEAHDDQYFRGGYVQWPANEDGTVERRFIEDDVLDDGVTVLTIFGLADGLQAGQAVGVYPSCDRTPTTCDGTFHNIDNYGGFEKMPGQSPFGNAIW